jgi:phage regulator Rha-like protein
MKFSDESILISIDSLLEEKMRIVNGEKVLLDFELAELLQVSTDELIRKVRANKDRFPSDFLIKLSAKKYLPAANKRRIIYAFTLAGIMMAAGRFRTERANKISIAMVDLICNRGFGMEKILSLIEKLP